MRDFDVHKYMPLTHMIYYFCFIRKFSSHCDDSRNPKHVIFSNGNLYRKQNVLFNSPYSNFSFVQLKMFYSWIFDESKMFHNWKLIFLEFQCKFFQGETCDVIRWWYYCISRYIINCLCACLSLQVSFGPLDGDRPVHKP